MHMCIHVDEYECVCNVSVYSTYIPARIKKCTHCAYQYHMGIYALIGNLPSITCSLSCGLCVIPNLWASKKIYLRRIYVSRVHLTCQNVSLNFIIKKLTFTHFYNFRKQVYISRLPILIVQHSGTREHVCWVTYPKHVKSRSIAMLFSSSYFMLMSAILDPKFLCLQLFRTLSRDVQWSNQNSNNTKLWPLPIFTFWLSFKWFYKGESTLRRSLVGQGILCCGSTTKDFQVKYPRNLHNIFWEICSSYHINFRPQMKLVTYIIKCVSSLMVNLWVSILHNV